MEPDQRHADLIIQELGLHESNSVITPGENEPRPKEGENEEPLEESEATRYRAIAVLAKYLAADRPDIMYSVKEICRGMERSHSHEV